MNIVLVLFCCFVGGIQNAMRWHFCSLWGASSLRMLGMMHWDAYVSGEGEEYEVGVDRLEGASNRSAVQEWFGLTPLESVLSTTHVFRGNIAVHPSTAELLWSRHMFYINRFFRNSGMRRRRVHGQDNIY